MSSQHLKLSGTPFRVPVRSASSFKWRLLGIRGLPFGSTSRILGNSLRSCETCSGTLLSNFPVCGLQFHSLYKTVSFFVDSYHPLAREGNLPSRLLVYVSFRRGVFVDDLTYRHLRDQPPSWLLGIAPRSDIRCFSCHQFFKQLLESWFDWLSCRLHPWW